MTLGGMAAAVGLIIDDSIGMVEHLVRRLREREERLPPRRARRALAHPRRGARSSPRR